MAAKIRPCLVLSIQTEPVDRVLVSLIPHTSSLQGTRFEVKVTAKFLKADAAFDAQQILTVPQVKLVRRLGELSAADLQQVERAAKLWLALE